MTLTRLLLLAALALPLAGCAELYELRDRTQVQEREIQRLRAELAQWQSSYSDLMAQRDREVTSRNSRIEELQTEINRLQTRQSQREIELETAAQQLQSQVQAAQTELATRQAETNDLRARMEQLTQSLQAAESERAGLLQQVQEIETTLGGMGVATPSESQSQQDARARLTDARERLQAALAARDRVITDLQQNLTQLEQQQAQGAQYSDAELDRIATYLTQTMEGVNGPKPTIRKDARRGVIVTFASSDLFESESTVVSQAARRSLATLGQALKQLPETSVLVVGHTDNQPVVNMPFRDNWALSASRAENVLRVLLEAGEVPGERLRFAGAGDSEPVGSNSTAEGRAANRRVEIVVTPDQESR
jgi:chemotaxis protein MotB